MSLQSFIAKLVLKLPDTWKVKLAGGTPTEIAGRVLDPNLQLLAHNAQKRPSLPSLPPEVAQKAAKDGYATIAAQPEPDVEWMDQTIPASDGYALPIRIYRPADQDKNLPALTYFHMGGGVIGDVELCHAFCSILASVMKTAIVSVGYRLAPQNKFPTGFEDCMAAYEWTLKHGSELGSKPGFAAVGGDSMGGNFTAVLAQETRRRDIPTPELQLLIYPATDMETEFESADLFGETFPLTMEVMTWFMQQYLPEGTERTDLLLSPALEPRLEDLAPAIIVTAGFDALCDHGVAYARKLKTAGVDVEYHCYESLSHGFTAYTAIAPAADTACRDIAQKAARLLRKVSTE